MPSPAKTPGTWRLLSRFLRILLPAFFLASSLGLYALSTFTFGDERSLLASRIGNFSARTAAAVAKLGSQAPQSQLESILGLLLSDPAVSCVLLIDDTGHAVASAPARVGCAGISAESRLDVSLNRGKSRATLSVKYNLQELEERTYMFRLFTLLALLVSLIVAGMVSWFSFRMIVGRPVNALLSAIQRTQTNGMPSKVENVPDDELGAVIQAFNGMQDKLEEEGRTTTNALRRLDYIYNDTPALMFSIGSDGHLLAVSGHWLDETGWSRKEVAGAPLERFLTCPKGGDMKEVTSRVLATDGALRDLPLILRRKDGSSMDVLLSSVPDVDDEGTARLCVLADISGLKAAQNELRLQAVTDHLTGLPNRQGLFEHLAALQGPGSNQSTAAALMFIDLDDFKAVNDTLGHDAGDELLKAVSARIKNCISSKDFFARLGGDEFAIVLHSLRQPEDAASVANRIVSTMARPFRIGEARATVGASIGIANFTDGQASDDILRLADLAMYQSKQSGKNKVSLYTNDLSAKVVARDIMVQKIRDGLSNDQFTYFLQPIVDLGTLQVHGAEALLRLNCPNDGLVSPGEIIRVAEETGLIGQVTAWSVAEGLRLSEELMPSMGRLGRYISINLSPRQITREFMTEFTNRLVEKPAVAQGLVVEITETALFSQDENISGLLATLRKTGVRIALDDFGTGYSSLGHIHRFPVDIIKLDRSFVRELGAEGENARRCRALIRATSALSAELGLTIIAEGIEDQKSLECLRDAGISNGQGYLFAPPMPVKAFMEWVGAFQKTDKPTGNVVRLAV